jgi:hypothetical protein
MQLQDGFVDFAELALELIGRSESDPKYLKFAAVNAQVALELFLKYHYSKKGLASKILKKKNGVPLNEFVEHAQILNNYYSDRKWSYGIKRELVLMMEARNSILHRAQQTEWNSELATNVVRTLFFIHSTWYSDFGGCLFERSYRGQHPLSKNKVWREGVDTFVHQLTELHDMEIRTCLACDQRAVVPGEFFGLAGAAGVEYLICLNCFDSIDIEHEARLLECHSCGDKSYIIDAFNEQDRQLYVGKCSECDENSWVRACANCKDFYHPETGETESGEKYFCSPDCSEMFDEKQLQRN